MAEALPEIPAAASVRRRLPSQRVSRRVLLRLRTVRQRYALAVMFLFTASAHFTSMKEDLIRMMPKAVPYPRQVVFLTGILEVLGAIGLLIPQLQRAAGICLILFLIAVFPANVHATRTEVTLRGKPVTPLGLRLPMQLIYIALVWWSTRIIL